MNTENWEKIKSVFAEVLEEPKERRGKILSKVCGGDTELRREIESLLAAHDQTNEHLIENKEFGVNSILQSNDAHYEGKQFGHYRIIREIGRGGMGAVFLASRSDGEFAQNVALKIVRRSFADAELERRFRRERQILASLNHPNIARLLDGGVSADGEPFLAMEYVEGWRIDDYCASRNLSINERLRLFLHVCRAVSFAHQNLVVHRDLKPSNILVTKDGTPKLLDFGIAKLTGAEHADEHTQTNFRAFTPEYAAPEQINGEPITTASDVYSLGILLEEILLGAKNHGGKAAAAVNGWKTKAAEISDGKTVNTNLPTNEENFNRMPATENKKFLNPELKNILAMARREEPARRYVSVAQFAEDIQKYLDGLPVRAQKDSFAYRAEKFVKRNKLAVGTIGLILLSLVGGLAIALWQADAARKERNRAERRFDDVRQLSNALLNDIAPKIERLEGSTEARQSLVTQSLKYLDSLAGESADDLTLQAELAGAYEKIGSLQGDARKPGLSDFRGALASLEKAQTIRRRLLEKNPADAENRRLLAENLQMLGIRRVFQNDIEGGFRDNIEAVRIYENLAAENPGSLELQRALLEAQLDYAAGYSDIGKYAEAVPMFQAAASKLETLHQANPDDAETWRIFAKSLGFLGFALSWESRQPEAEREMTRGLELAESLAARFPNDANLRQNLLNFYQLAAAIYEEVDDARAFGYVEKARKGYEEIVANDRANAQARNQLAGIFSRLGTSAANLGKPAEALAYLEKAAAIFSELREKDPQSRAYDRQTSVVYKRIGDAKYKQPDLAGALAAYQKSRALIEKELENDAANTLVLRDLAMVCRNIGWVHGDYIKITAGQIRQTHLQAARENYKRALDVLLKAESQKALSEIDRKLLEEVRAGVEQFEEMS